MARTARKAVTVATVEDVVVDAEIRNVGEAAAEVAAALAVPGFLAR